MPSDRRRQSRGRRRRPRKDRLIQTRVAEDLEQTLKREAARQRLTVSHLIRNTLEDTFNLVEDVTTDVEQLVSGSVELAAAVGRDARRFASIVRGRPVEGEAASVSPEHSEIAEKAADGAPRAARGAGDESEPLDHIYGWNRVVANRAASCAQCRGAIEKGDDALVGLSDDSTKPRAWLCADCAEEL